MSDVTTRMVARPVWARRERRLAGEELGPPTEKEKHDAIRVLEDGIRFPVSLYVEAERIMAEENGVGNGGVVAADEARQRGGRMTGKQSYALGLLRRARCESPDTDDGVVSTETFYDVEIGVAFVHWRTAGSLRRLGLLTYGPYDPDNGTSLTLTDIGAAAA